MLKSVELTSSLLQIFKKLELSTSEFRICLLIELRFNVEDEQADHDSVGYETLIDGDLSTAKTCVRSRDRDGDHHRAYQLHPAKIQIIGNEPEYDVNGQNWKTRHLLGE